MLKRQAEGRAIPFSINMLVLEHGLCVYKRIFFFDGCGSVPSTCGDALV
jgi:hypothetical protein